METTEIPTLTKRRLQAQVVGAIYAEMVEQIGQDQARAILDAAIRKAAVAEGREFAAREPVYSARIAAVKKSLSTVRD